MRNLAANCFRALCLLIVMSSISTAQSVSDDFTDGDFTANPAWTGDTGVFSVITDATVPGGNASTDGNFLAADANVGQSVLQTAAGLVTEWRFSLATPDFNPSSANYFGVILMSDTELSGDITSTSWNGYYLRIGVNGSTDPISFYRRSGSTSTSGVDFPSSPNFGNGALQDGLDIRVTRSPSGVFELFYNAGFEYSSIPATSAGTITDNTHNTSSYFGVFTRFGNPSTARRIYLDNVALFDSPQINNIVRSPSVPLASQSATISADVTDGNGINSVDLNYRINGGSTQTVSMSNTGGDTYEGDIPTSEYSAGDRVEHWIVAEDNAAETTTTPTTGFFAGTTQISTLRAIDGNGILLYAGYGARVTGVATVASGVFSSTHLDVYLQDATGGINLFKLNEGSTNITLYNEYTAFGTLLSFNGKAEIVPDNSSTDVTDNGSGTIPTPLIRTIAQALANAETLEGMLVGIQHIENTGSGDSWPSSGSNANLDISDGSGNMIMRIDQDTDIDENSEPAWPKDVVGIFNQFDTSLPLDDGYQILPRSFADILDDGALPVSLSTFVAVAGDGIVNLNWVTESEVQNVGFKVLRAEAPDGNYLELSSYENNPDLAGQFNSSVAHTYSYEDRLVVNGGSYWYKLVDVDANNVHTEHGPINAAPGLVVAGELPTEFQLRPNFPNPFNPGTNIPFDVPVSEKSSLPVKVVVYNSLGQPVKTIVDARFEAGEYVAFWGGDNRANEAVSGGVYFAVLTAGDFRQTVKLTLLR